MIEVKYILKFEYQKLEAQIAKLEEENLQLTAKGEQLRLDYVRLEEAYQKIVTDFVKFKERMEELDILDEFSNFF